MTLSHSLSQKRDWFHSLWVSDVRHRSQSSVDSCFTDRPAGLCSSDTRPRGGFGRVFEACYWRASVSFRSGFYAFSETQSPWKQRRPGQNSLVGPNEHCVMVNKWKTVVGESYRKNKRSWKVCESGYWRWPEQKLIKRASGFPSRMCL